MDVEIFEPGYVWTGPKMFLEVSLCSRAKQQQRNVQKSVLHVQSCFLLIRPFFAVYVAVAA